MARGDAVYGNTNVDWPTDPRCMSLKSDSSRWMNHILWLTAVKERREVLPLRYNFRYFAALFGKKSGNVQRWVEDGVSQGLIEIMQDGAIKVIGVEGCHRKLKWKDSPYGDDGVPIDQGRRERRRGRVEKEREIDYVNSINEDLPPSKIKQITVDPSFVVYPNNPDITPDQLKVANVCQKLEKLSNYETYKGNWVVFANFIGQGLDIEILEKSVNNFITDNESQDKPRKYSKHHSNIADVEYTAQKTVKTPQTEPNIDLLKKIEAIAERKRKEWKEKGGK